MRDETFVVHRVEREGTSFVYSGAARFSSRFDTSTTTCA